LTAVFAGLILFFLSIQTALAIPAMQQRCEPNLTCIISEYVFNDDGHTPITTDDYCKITITNPNDVVILNQANMPDKNDGLYYYSTTTLSSPEGLYRALICCDTTGPEYLCIDKTFILGTSFETLPEKIWSYTGSALDTADNAIAKVWSYATRKLSSRQIGSSLEYIAGVTNPVAVVQVAEKSVADAIDYNVDLIRGATFDFAGFADSGTTLTLVDAELDQPDDYWNNYRLKMMSGANFGEEQTVSDFDAVSDTLTVSSPFSFTIATDDKYVLQHETRLVYQIWNATTRTLTSFGTLVSDIWSNSTRTLSAFGSLAADVWSGTFAPTRRLTDETLTGGGELATLADINTATGTIISTLQGSNPSADLTLLAGYVDSVEGYIGLPADTTPSTLFGAIKDVRTKLDQLDTLETKLNTIDTVVDLLRASQILGYALELSDAGEILETKDYRAKLTVLNYESNLVDPSSTPTIILYDALRATAISTNMTKLSTGVYEFVYTVPSGAANGTWEALASVDLGGSLPAQLNDYFEVEGSPARVAINSVSDVTVPTISANVTISNEGSVGYEYQYEYCVVAQEDNQCGGGDDVAYALAAKYLNAGQDWTTDLPLTVSSTGSYWFKVVVYWGTEASGAVRTFTATEEAAPAPAGGGSSGGGVSLCGETASLNDIYCKLLEIQKELGYHGEPTTNIGISAYQTLKALSGSLKGIGGTKGYNLDQLYEVSSVGGTDLLYLKNKSLEMKALLDANKILIDKAANKPVIETWFEWGSVILKMLVINPSKSQTQVVPFKVYLPRETKPEYIIDQEDLLLDFDEEAGLWYVHKDIELASGQSVTKKVEIKDVWIISQEETDSLRKQFDDLIKPLEGTAFYAQAVTLKSDADRLLDGILRKQNEYKATPQEHILAYRENQEDLKAVKTDLEALKQLVTEESNAGRAIGSLFGVSTTMTWAIIIIVVVGIALLMILLYTLLMRHRALQEYIAPGQKLKGPPMMPGFKKEAVKIKGGFITYFLPPFGRPLVDTRKLIKIVIVLILGGILIALFLLYRYFF